MYIYIQAGHDSPYTSVNLRRMFGVKMDNWRVAYFLTFPLISQSLSICRQYRVAMAALLLLVMQGESLLVGLLGYLDRRHRGLLFINDGEAVALHLV